MAGLAGPPLPELSTIVCIVWRNVGEFRGQRWADDVTPAAPSPGVISSWVYTTDTAVK
jgi:hypothetical protein